MCFKVLSTSTPLDKRGFRSFLQNFDSWNTGSSSSVLVHKGHEVSYFDFFFLCYSLWRLINRLIFLGPYFYRPHDELISSHGRKGSTNNHTNHYSSESWPFTISNYCVSRKSCQTVAVCKCLGNVIVCHEKQMKSRIWLKDWVFAQTKPFQNKETMSGSWQLTSAQEGWQFYTGVICT